MPSGSAKQMKLRRARVPLRMYLRCIYVFKGNLKLPGCCLCTHHHPSTTTIANASGSMSLFHFLRTPAKAISNRLTFDVSLNSSDSNPQAFNLRCLCEFERKQSPRYNTFDSSVESSESKPQSL